MKFFSANLKPHFCLFVVLLFLTLFGQLLHSSAHKSASFDEVYHLIAGYAYATTGSRQLNQEVLPLGGLLANLPLQVTGRTLPFDSSVLLSGDFTASEQFWQADPNPAQAIWLARWGGIWATLLLAAIIFRFAADLFGWQGGVLALLLAATDPNLIANGRLATRDLLLTLFATLAVWLLWRGCARRTPRWPYIVAAGIALGLASATRYSAALLGPTLLVLAFAVPGARSSRDYLHRALAITLVALTGFLTLWAVYRFETGPLASLGGLSVPAPAFWQGAELFLGRVSRGTPLFLLGNRIDVPTQRYYLLLVWLLKTPLSTLGLAGLALAWNRQHTPGRSWQPALGLLLSALVFLAAATATATVVAYRYLLPVTALTLVLAGGAAGWLVTTGWLRRLTLMGGVTAVVSAILIFPHHQSYLNLLAGGAPNGYRVLVDSNLDWGQDLPALRAWMAANHVEHINLSYFGTADPADYGITNYTALPGFKRHLFGPEVDAYNPYAPQPGIYAISATSLQLGLVDGYPDLYAYFRALQPVGRAGYSILIYRIEAPPEDLLDRVVVTGQRVADLTPEQLGLSLTRPASVKWAVNSSALVLATGSPARYLNANLDLLAPPIAEALQTTVQTSGEGWFVATAPHITGLPGLCHIVHTPDGESFDSTPLSNTTGLNLIGYTLSDTMASADAHAPNTLTLTTYWRLQQPPLATPLAQFVHWLDDTGNIVAQFDGWDIASYGLEQGDVIVQQAVLQADADPAAATIAVGFYSPVSLTRHPFILPDGGQIDRLLLSCE